MKTTKQCPKCGSTEIYTDEGLTKRGDRCSIPLTGWRSFFVSVYVCMKCGYIEEYLADSEINDRNMLEKIREKWIRLQ